MCAWLVLFATPWLGCGPATFTDGGEPNRPAAGRVRTSDTFDLETVALPPPDLSAHPPDVLTGREVALRVRNHVSVRGGYRLELEPETGQTMLLEYRIARAVRLPIEVGESLRWRLPLDSQLEPAGLVVREEDGTLRVLVVTSEDTSALANEVGALGITPDFSSGSLVYNESFAVMSCLINIDHHPLRVSDGRDVVSVRPGTSRIVELVDTRRAPRVTLGQHGDDEDPLPYELLVLDVSRPSQGGDDPRCPRRSHVSWTLLRERTL